MAYSLPMLPCGFVGGDLKPSDVFSGNMTPLPAIGSSQEARRSDPEREIPMVPADSGDVSERRREPLYPEIAALPFVAMYDDGTKKVEEVPKDSVENALEFTDQDLANALMPVIGGILNKGGTVDPLLEPMLRATVRRALAEHSPSDRPFQRLGFLDKSMWRLQAIFTSRKFEDIVFEKTHRFQVDEVYVYDKSTFGLVSYASCDPVRHAHARRVEVSAKKVAMEICKDQGEARITFEMQDGRHVVVEEGVHICLAAVVRGHMNEMIASDLQFSVKRIEQRFGERLALQGTALMRVLQPFLEDCLLIQAPGGSCS